MKKLSKRLQAINNMIDTHYQNIWDCCCDHGLLGLTLLNRKTADIIHFVDIVPSLTTRLESLLEKYFGGSPLPLAEKKLTVKTISRVSVSLYKCPKLKLQ